MSARDRPRREVSPRAPEYEARPGPGRSHAALASGAPPSPSAAVIPALALLPLRLFLGGTFLYAGLDKLLDPAFLSAEGQGSIGAQMAAFAHTSPLAPLVVAFGEPFAVPLGLAISLAEIAIGVGTLAGLLFRLSAAGGAALATLFWLTASWATKPYYYGPDLPYALGWISLALAGTGGILTPDRILAALRPRPSPRELRRQRLSATYGRPALDDPSMLSRRAVLEAGLVGGASVLLASVAAAFAPLLRGREGGGTVSSAESAGTTASRSTAAGAGRSAEPSLAPSSASGEASSAAAASAPVATPGGPVIGRLDRLRLDHPLAFTDPSSGDPSAVLLLPNGKIVAYDLTCTHAGCPVEYDPSSQLLICPCHGAEFDPAHGAEVVAGPTDQPLAALPISVNRTTGEITLAS